MKLKILALLLVISLLIVPAQATIQNPISSADSTKAYTKYLETFYRSVTQTYLSRTLWSGYQTFPIYDETGGDYFNYWIDDHGKILLAANTLGDQSLRNRASTFLMQSYYPEGPFFPGRMVNSSVYRDVAPGPITNVDYYATNRLVAVINASAVEGSKVYERAVTIGSVWDNKTATKVAPLDIKSPFVVDIAPVELWFGNDSTHLRRVGFGGTHPSTQTLELIETIGPFGLLAERSNLTVRRTINVVDPLAQITGVQLITDTIITKWRPYATIQMKVVNGWTNPIIVQNVTLGLCSNDHYSPYIPYFWWLKKADGSVTGPTLLYRGVNATLWNGLGSRPVSNLFTGFQTPEFAVKGYKVTILSPALSKIFYTLDYGHSIQYTFNRTETVPATGSGSVEQILLNPMEKTPWGYADKALALNDLNIPDGWTLSMPGSWGPTLYALAEYAVLTGNSEVLDRAEDFWNFYYDDVSQRLAPTWIPENPKHRPVVYYRSLYPHALTGLILDPSNSTYLLWAQNVTQKAIFEEQDLNPGSANYGGLPLGLEEDGWAYALLMKLYQITGQRNYQTVAYQIRNAITANLGWTTDATWPPQPASATAHLPSVITLNPDGSASSVYSNHPQNIFRSSEMTYGFILGSTFEGTDSPLMYDSPLLLGTVTNLWKMTVDQGSGKLSVNVRYPDDVTGQSNSETQPLGMLALAIWKQAMYNRTVGVYVEKVGSATLRNLVYQTTGGNLTVTLKGVDSGSATAILYYRDGAPTVIFSSGSGSGVYDGATKLYTVSATLNSTGFAVFKVVHPTQPTGPDIAIIAAAGGVASIIAAVIYVTRKKVKSG